jgi:drug/metabolite transporter (DMT)-like permease
VQKSDGRAGIGLAVLASATFGSSGSFAESLISTGWSPAGVVAARVSIAALLLTIPAVLSLRGRWHLLKQSAPTILIFGVFAVAACQVFYFNAVSRLSVGVALLLEYLGVILVVLWMWLRHGHRPRRLTLGGAAVALIGLVLVLNLAGSHHLDPVGVLWGLAAAVGLAVFFTLAAKADEPLPPIALAWSGMVLGAVLLLVTGASGLVSLQASTSNVVFAHHQVSYLVPILGLAAVSGAFAYVASIGASRRLGAKLASFVGLTEVLFAVLFAWVLLNQLPGIMQLVGGLFIIGGVVLVRVDELRTPSGPDIAGAPADSPLAAVEAVL